MRLYTYISESAKNHGYPTLADLNKVKINGNISIEYVDTITQFWKESKDTWVVNRPIGAHEIHLGVGSPRREYGRYTTEELLKFIKKDYYRKDLVSFDINPPNQYNEIPFDHD